MHIWTFKKIHNDKTEKFDAYVLFEQLHNSKIASKSAFLACLQHKSFVPTLWFEEKLIECISFDLKGHKVSDTQFSFVTPSRAPMFEHMEFEQFIFLGIASRDTIATHHQI